MSRLTMKDVEKHIAQMNDAMGRPVESWTNGKSNIGCYHLYSDATGYALHCIANEGGGVHSVVYGSLREIDMFVRGMWKAAIELK